MRIRVSILLLKDKRLYAKVAPSLPSDFLEKIDGIHVGVDKLPCSVAAFSGKKNVVTDLHNDPFYIDCRPLAKAYAITSCWSMPIVASSGDVLGTFAFYSETPRTPTKIEMDLILTATDLAEIGESIRQV